MKSRVAILAMLVTGMVFSTAGAGLALSGSHDNASIAQYPSVTPTCTNSPSGGTSPSPNGAPMCTPTPTCTEVPSGGTSPASGGTPTCTPTPEGGVLPAGAQSTPTPEGGVLPAATNAPSGGVAPAEATNTQPVRQEAAATNSQLPFTGFAAIPVILGGLALLTGGLVLRRRTRGE